MSRIKNRIIVAVWVLALISILACGALGTEEVIEPEADTIYAVVNDVPITIGEITQRTLDAYGDYVFNIMIDEIILEQEFEKRKIKTKRKIIKRREKCIQRELGGEEYYALWLIQQGFTPEQMREKIKKQIMIEKLVTQMRGITVTKEEIKESYEEYRKHFVEDIPFNKVTKEGLRMVLMKAKVMPYIADVMNELRSKAKIELRYQQ